jgi:hypothetical protein
VQSSTDYTAADNATAFADESGFDLHRQRQHWPVVRRPAHPNQASRRGDVRHQRWRKATVRYQGHHEDAELRSGVPDQVSRSARPHARGDARRCGGRVKGCTRLSASDLSGQREPSGSSRRLSPSSKNKWCGRGETVVTKKERSVHVVEVLIHDDEGAPPLLRVVQATTGPRSTRWTLPSATGGDVGGSTRGSARTRVASSRTTHGRTCSGRLTARSSPDRNSWIAGGPWPS